MRQTGLLTLLSILMLGLLVACGGANKMTPTPFPATWTPGPALAAQESFGVDIAELLADPEMYADAYVQVRGLYQKRPLLVCESVSATNISPATWELMDNSGLRLNAGEFDQALRSLVPDGLTMTVAGYWQLWEGPIGCGKQAEKQAIWFLEVTDIISPSPIVQVTLPPTALGDPLFSDEVVTPDGGTDPNDQLTPMPTEDVVIVPETMTPFPTDVTVTAVSDDAFATPSPTTVFDDGNVPTATSGSNQSSTSTPLATSANGTATRQATATIGSGSGNATPTVAGTAKATNTPSSGSINIVNVDTIGEEEIGFGLMPSNEIHDWQLGLSERSVITISLAAEPQLKLNLEIFDQNNNVISSSNTATANQIETVKSLTVDPDKAYTIRVRNSTTNEEGSYVVLVWGNMEDSSILDARGILEDGQMKSATSPPIENAGHYWFFYGEEDEVISINTTADGSHSMWMLLYDPEGIPMDIDGAVFVEESIEDITLPLTGLYSILVEEYFYEMANYTIKLTK